MRDADEWQTFLEGRLRDRHAVVLGGAGFLGAHLSRRLMALGAEVTVVDTFITSRRDTVDELRRSPGVTVIEADIVREIPVSSPVDYVLNFASPASPVDYVQLPLETLRVGSIGTETGLILAREQDATFMTASTSEVYGDPLVSPQPETYWGNVNPIGPRSMYDEAKRYAEALTMAYHHLHGVDIRLPRIFNTYGPGMRSDDGRAVPSFISAAVQHQPVTLHGEGDQTRSLCFVDDLIEGLLRLLVSDYNGPVNIGNPQEISMRELADVVVELADSTSRIVHTRRPGDDPQVRRPDLSLARELFGFAPRVDLITGLARTISWFQSCEPPSEQVTIDLSEYEDGPATSNASEMRSA